MALFDKLKDKKKEEEKKTTAKKAATSKSVPAKGGIKVAPAKAPAGLVVLEEPAATKKTAAKPHGKAENRKNVHKRGRTRKAEKRNK